jgi:hypothetical protein
LSSLITIGWDHAALCVGHDGPLVAIAEMTSDGFSVTGFHPFCNHARRVLILRCDDFDPEYAERVVAKCLTFEDSEYDTQHEWGDGELDCGELPAKSDYEGRLELPLRYNPLTGDDLVFPGDLLRCENVTVIWDSAGKLKSKVKR